MNKKNTNEIKTVKKEDYARLEREYIKTKLALAQFTDAPVVRDMDDIPKDLQNQTFALLNRDTKTGAPKKLESFPLKDVSITYFGITSLFDDYINRERYIRSRGTSEDQEKVKKLLVSHTGSDRGAETRSALGIFFRFVVEVINPKVVDIRHLLDTRAVDAFPRWYEATGKKPSTIGNVIKMIRMFLKYLHGREEFANYRSRIDAVDDVLRVPGAKAKDVAKSMANKTVAESMMVLGEWLDHNELRKLNELVCNKVTNWIEKDSAFVNGESEESKLSRADMRLFMGHLFLLTLMHLGGQRRQFGASLTKQNVVFDGTEARFFAPREKVKRAKTDFFILPATFAIPLRIWIEFYLPILANKGVESVWINVQGNAMRYAGLSKLVSSIVASYFPGRTITCTYFRRALVTFLTQHHLSNDEEGIAKFFSEKHAALINTSPEVLKTHYDRVHRSDVNKTTLETVNSTTGMKPTDSMAKMLSIFQKKYKKQSDDFANSVDCIIDHCFVTRSSVEFTVRFKDGKTSTFPGHRLQPFMHLVVDYWASVGGRSCSGKSPTKEGNLEGKGNDQDSAQGYPADSWESFEADTSEASSNEACSDGEEEGEEDSDEEFDLDSSSSSSSSSSSEASTALWSSPSDSRSSLGSVMSKSSNINESFQVPSQTLPLSPFDEDSSPLAVPVKPTKRKITKTVEAHPSPTVGLQSKTPVRTAAKPKASARKTPTPSRPPSKPARKGENPPSDSHQEREKLKFYVNLFPSIQRNPAAKRKLTSLSTTVLDKAPEKKKQKKMSSVTKLEPGGT